MANRNLELSKLAYEVAEQSLKNKDMSIPKLAKDSGISRSSITSMRLVLMYGSDEEKELARTAQKGMRILCDEIRKRMTPEQKAAMKDIKYERAWNHDRKVMITSNANVWRPLGSALADLSALPSPQDMVRISKGNNAREFTINKHLERAFNWLKEFEYEWRFFQLSKSTEDTSNPGTGSATAGSQQPKPSTE